ncbi:MAG: hypothetical protein ABW003_12980 [Microvirga sp.]
MIAYYTRSSFGPCLVICERPCNGEEYQNALRVYFESKREARAYCKANNIEPWNF